MMERGLEKIEGGLFNVSGRLRGIDAGYEICRNRLTGGYEIYKGGAFAFAAPFHALDARTEEYVRKTSIGNAERILNEIEFHNAETERRASVAARYKTEEIYDC